MENKEPSNNNQSDIIRADKDYPSSADWKNFVLSFGSDTTKTTLNSSAKRASSFITNPYIQNARVKKIAGTIFGGEDRKILEEAVGLPDENEETLQSYANRLNFSNYPLYRKNRLPSDILTYHNYSIPLDVMKDKTKKEEDEMLISSWRQCFKPSYQFRRIASQVAVSGKVAYYYRQSITKVQNVARDEIIEYADKKRRVEAAFLQQLPANYWKIIGFTDKNYYKVAFNFMYFLEGGNDINFFDKFFVDAYKTLYGEESSILQDLGNASRRQLLKKDMKKKVIQVGTRKFIVNPEGQLKDGFTFESSGSEWFYWVELPADRCFVFSEQESSPIVAPSTTGVFLQAKDLESYAILQQQLASLPLNSMVVGEIPFHENNLSGNTNDDFKVTPETMLFFNDLFNLTAPAGTGVQGLPYKNLKLLQFDGVANGSDIYLKAMQQFLISTGLGSLFTLTDKPNEAQVKTAQILEARYADFMYKQFENFVSIVYNRLLGLHHRWEFHIFGDCFSDPNTLTQLKEGLSLGQSYLWPRYIAMQDYSMDGAMATMEYLSDNKIYDKFIPLANSYTTSGGRPEKTNPSGSDKLEEKTKAAEGEE